MRPLLAALLILGAGCGVARGIPIVGDFVPDPAMENARTQQQNMLVNMTHKPEWKSLCDAGKFRSALAYVEAHKDEIGETNAKQMTDDTHRECKSYLNDRLLRFRRYLGDIKSQKELADMKADDFTVVFNLPKSDELLLTTPAYDWARGHFSALEDFRSRKPTGEGLLKAVSDASALPPDEDGEHRWFDVIENLVFRAMSDAVLAEVAAAQDAPRAQRLVGKARVETLQTKWIGMLKSVDEKHRLRMAEHEVQIFKPLEEFPKDLAELEAIDLSACLAAPQPEVELRKAEKSLRALENRTSITRESRQRLYTLLVTAVSLRLFLAEKEESDAAAELRSYGEKLKKVGGPGDTRAYGARVQKVFETILR
jgi:hypothetical protein